MEQWWQPNVGNGKEKWFMLELIALVGTLGVRIEKRRNRMAEEQPRKFRGEVYAHEAGIANEVNSSVPYVA
jgi:hypothetical protein